jgi:spore maturation protein CgeB
LFAGAELVIELPATPEVCSSIGVSVYETGCSQTVFDAAAVATATVTFERPGVHAFFEVGAEIVTYERSSELPELIAMVCADPDLIASVGEAACNRVAGGHRWTERWASLFGHWGMKVDSDPGEDVRVIVERADAATAQGRVPETVPV